MVTLDIHVAIPVGSRDLIEQGQVVFRATRRRKLLADPGWQAYAVKVQPLVLTQQNKLLVPAPFSPWANGPAHA